MNPKPILLIKFPSFFSDRLLEVSGDNLLKNEKLHEDYHIFIVKSATNPELTIEIASIHNVSDITLEELKRQVLQTIKSKSDE